MQSPALSWPSWQRATPGMACVELCRCKRVPGSEICKSLDAPVDTQTSCHCLSLQSRQRSQQQELDSESESELRLKPVWKLAQPHFCSVVCRTSRCGARRR